MIKSIVSFIIGFLVGTVFGATIIRMALERLSGWKIHKTIKKCQKKN